MSLLGRRVLVGRIAGLYGVQGWLKIESWTEPRDRIFDYQPWQLDLVPQGLTREISGIKGRTLGKRLICKLPDVDDCDAGSVLLGCDISIARQLLPPLAQNEYYWTDLEGLEVVTLEGALLGEVSHLFATGANDVVVVKHGTREYLIPFVQGVYVCSVDIAGRRMVVDWDPEL